MGDDTAMIILTNYQNFVPDSIEAFKSIQGKLTAGLRQMLPRQTNITDFFPVALPSLAITAKPDALALPTRAPKAAPARHKCGRAGYSIHGHIMLRQRCSGGLYTALPTSKPAVLYTPSSLMSGMMLFSEGALTTQASWRGPQAGGGEEGPQQQYLQATHHPGLRGDTPEGW
jgi:hypothetical protein